MRICPKCGYREPECWRNLRWSLYVEYCHLDELEVFEPELAAEIEKVRPTRLPLEQAPFVYKLSRSGYVKRMDLESYKAYGFHGRYMESKRRAQRLAGTDKQQRLTDFEVQEGAMAPRKKEAVLE